MNKYQLHVKEGYYSANTIIKLLFLILKHRLYHLVTEGKWKD